MQLSTSTRIPHFSFLSLTRSIQPCLYWSCGNVLINSNKRKISPFLSLLKMNRQRGHWFKSHLFPIHTFTNSTKSRHHRKNNPSVLLWFILLYFFSFNTVRCQSYPDAAAGFRKMKLHTSLNAELKISKALWGFTKGRPCLTSLVDFNNGLLASPDKRANDVVYPDFCRASDMAPHHILKSLSWRNIDLTGGLFSG